MKPTGVTFAGQFNTSDFCANFAPVAEGKRCRLLSVFPVSKKDDSASATWTTTTLDFLDGGSSGTSRFKIFIDSSAKTTPAIDIPEHGILFEDGIYCKVTSAGTGGFSPTYYCLKSLSITYEGMP